jgi:hypothetical protein
MMKARTLIAAFAALAALAACSTKALTPVPSSEPVRSLSEIYSTKNIIYPFQFSTGILTVPGEPSSLQSSYDIPTRTHFEMNAGGTFASVVWNPGDSFLMLALDSASGNAYAAGYTTLEGGETATFTTLDGLPASDKFYSIYSDGISGYADLSDYGYGLAILVPIPTDQTAVAGNVAPETNVSAAISASRTENLHFQNIGSVLKFRLSGALVPSIKSVVLQGSSPLSGPAMVYFDSEGNVQSTYEFGFDGTSSKITLSGSFEAGKDYYIVLGAGDQNGLTLSFAGDDGVVNKVVSKTVSFPRGRIRDFGTIDIGDTFPTYSGPSAELYIRATAGLKPVSIAVVPDGFTAAELDRYEMLAKSGIEAMFATEPFKSYRSYFNVWLLKVASNESGANITDGNGNITTPRDCYFGSKWGSDSYGDMSLDETTLYNFVKTYCPDLSDLSHNDREVAVLVIINDDRYGGICHSYANGKAYCQAPVTGGGGMLGWGYPEITAVSESDPSQGTRATTDEEYAALGINYGDWRNTLVHEFGGHAFSRLNDEYWYDSALDPVSQISEHAWPVPFGLNISATYELPLWQTDLLSRKAELVQSNPLYERLGVFQGGDYSSLNRWRCEKISCMIDNRFYFSVWQRELIVRRIMDLAGGTFSLESFLALDNPTDPLRDVAVSGTPGARVREAAVVPIMPPLPPPVLHK